MKDADQVANNITELMDLSDQKRHRPQLMKEGWIVGMNKHGLIQI